MIRYWSSRHRWCLLLALMAVTTVTTPARATLVFYYDPETGNVAFDTAGTRNGELLNFGLAINHHVSSIRFIPENHIRLSESKFYFSNPINIVDTSLSKPLIGYYTIGNILPTGLTSETWENLFVHSRNSGSFSSQSTALGGHGYSDVLGGGPTPIAEFVYGLPSLDFDNRWDLVDPDSLDWARNVNLIYLSSTGEVILDTSGPDSGYIARFQFTSDNRFLAENFDVQIDAHIKGANASQIYLFSDAIEPGQYSFGHILPSNLTPQEFLSVFTEINFLGRSAFGGQHVEFGNENLPVTLEFRARVPEPTTAVIAASLLAYLPTRRRRFVGQV